MVKNITQKRSGKKTDREEWSGKYLLNVEDGIRGVRYLFSFPGLIEDFQLAHPVLLGLSWRHTFACTAPAS
jgi:hypothetical protein